MIYVEVECPECNEINQIDETLKKFFCVNCGSEVKVEYEAIYEPEDDAPIAPATLSDDDAAKRLTRAVLFVEDGDWAHAWSYCESVLDYDPKNAEAYLIELMISLRVHSISELKSCESRFQDHPLMKKTQRFAGDDLRLLIACVLQPLRLAATASKRYDNAKEYMDAAIESEGSDLVREGLLQEAIILFDKLGSYKDSAALADTCRELKASFAS